MSSDSLAQLRSLYPGRLTLSAEEVALVLRHTTARGVVQKVRERMQNGRYPDARKVDGRWHMPMDVVAEILDPTPQTTGQTTSVPRGAAPRLGGRRRSAIGPRMRFLRDAPFWAQVFRASGWADDAQSLLSEWTEERQALQDHFNSVRAARTKALSRHFCLTPKVRMVYVPQIWLLARTLIRPRNKTQTISPQKRNGDA